MKNNRILTESEKKEILTNKEQLIIESFREQFNKIKRIDENELKELISESINEDMKGFLISKVVPKIQEAGVQFLPFISGQIQQEAVDQVKGFENGAAISYRVAPNNKGVEMVRIIVNMSKKDVLNKVIKHFGITSGQSDSKDAPGEGGAFSGKRQVGGGETSNSGDITLYNGEPTDWDGVWSVELIREQFNKIKGIDENELKEEDGANAKNILDQVKNFVDDTSAIASGWYISNGMKPEEDWLNQINYTKGEVMRKVNSQRGDSLEEKLKGFFEQSKSHFGLEEPPYGSKSSDFRTVMKKMRDKNGFINATRVDANEAFKIGDKYSTQVSNIIFSVSGMKPFDFMSLMFKG